MPSLIELVAAHPIRQKPYDAIAFVRFDGNGVPLYRVAGETRDKGALEALKAAMRLYGGHCFHCGAFMPPQPMSHAATRDHVRPRQSGGLNLLHNLVFACGPCNRLKGAKELPSFSVERSVDYLRALDEHLTRCVMALRAAEG